MQGDLISRSELLKQFPVNLEAPFWHVNGIRKAIGAMDAIDAVTVVHAYWIGMEYDGYADGFPVFDTWGCSVCGEEYCSEGEPPVCNYCPNCGAKMDGDPHDSP